MEYLFCKCNFFNALLPDFLLQFGKYIESKQRPEWVGKYMDYKELKELVKQASSQEEAVSRDDGNFISLINIRKLN